MASTGLVETKNCICHDFVQNKMLLYARSLWISSFLYMNVQAQMHGLLQIGIYRPEVHNQENPTCF